MIKLKPVFDSVKLFRYLVDDLFCDSITSEVEYQVKCQAGHSVQNLTWISICSSVRNEIWLEINDQIKTSF